MMIAVRTIRLLGVGTLLLAALMALPIAGAQEAQPSSLLSLSTKQHASALSASMNAAQALPAPLGVHTVAQLMPSQAHNDDSVLLMAVLATMLVLAAEIARRSVQRFQL